MHAQSRGRRHEFLCATLGSARLQSPHSCPSGPPVGDSSYCGGARVGLPGHHRFGDMRKDSNYREEEGKSEEDAVSPPARGLYL